MSNIFCLPVGLYERVEVRLALPPPLTFKYCASPAENCQIEMVLAVRFELPIGGLRNCVIVYHQVLLHSNWNFYINCLNHLLCVKYQPVTLRRDSYFGFN